MVLVTDIERKLKSGKVVKGFYMQGYLAQNLAPVPQYLAKAWDCVGIISGHGKVRIGKSTLASQVGIYLAWLIAGGEMIFDEEGKEVIEVVKPKKPIRFNLKENVVFSADDLQDQAFRLYEKYGKHQVIIYDEGRQGLDSSRAMENINKGMQDFFQECGFMGHVILIVVPNFFKLHEDYSVARSLFLIDVFASKELERGYFNFYNEHQKELLYFFGKKKLGITAKYGSAYPSFWGRFTRWLPFDKDEYESAKKEALKKKMLSRSDKRIKLQRDVLIWMLNKDYNIKVKDIKDRLKEISGVDLSKKYFVNIITFVADFRLKEKGY